MRYFILVVIALLSLVIESTFLNSLKVYDLKPDLILVLVVFSTFIYGKKEGMKLSFIFGLLEDLFLCKYIGLNAATRMLTSYVIGFGEDKIYKENLLVPILGLFIGTYINNFIYILLAGLSNIDTNIAIYIWATTFPEALFNAVLAAFLYFKFYKEATKGILK